jgi:two-component system OmpR family response regulator
MWNNTIVWIEDEAEILKEGLHFLRKEGFKAEGFNSLESARQKLSAGDIDLVILDWMLPGVSGAEACKYIINTYGLPVIMLTARTEEMDKVIILEIGADDYMEKPFGMRELAARIRTVLRRIKKEKSIDDEQKNESISYLEMTIDKISREVRINNIPVELTATEYNILITLASNPGRVYTRNQLIEAVMGNSYFGYERTLDSHIRNLRKKIGDDAGNPIYIRTVYAVGYKFGDRERL